MLVNIGLSWNEIVLTRHQIPKLNTEVVSCMEYKIGKWAILILAFHGTRLFSEDKIQLFPN